MTLPPLWRLLCCGRLVKEDGKMGVLLGMLCVCVCAVYVCVCVYVHVCVCKVLWVVECFSLNINLLYLIYLCLPSDKVILDQINSKQCQRKRVGITLKVKGIPREGFFFFFFFFFSFLFFSFLFFSFLFFSFLFFSFLFFFSFFYFIYFFLLFSLFFTHSFDF